MKFRKFKNRAKTFSNFDCQAQGWCGLNNMNFGKVFHQVYCMQELFSKYCTKEDG
jgi:hypothetical protein